ncbi:MAG: Kazal-type serine protease inhibitor [Candidatus Micrarchaeota archaeon]
MKLLFILFIGLMVLSAGCLGGTNCPDTKDYVCGVDGKTYNNQCLADKSNVKVDYEGPCRASICDDSDGGKDTLAVGRTSAEGSSNTDSCKDKLTVTEYYCEGNSISSMAIPCPLGYVCESGKCSVSPCDDSDGGIKPLEKGTASASGKTSTDECKSAEAVTEYYCDGSVVTSKTVDCSLGQQCVDGACVEYPCSDSDGGEDELEAGTVTKGDQSSDDKCSGVTAVTEYYCSGDKISSKKISCASDFECVDGACVKIAPCSDSDGGKDKFTKGTLKTPDHEYQDSCYSDTSVLEYYCSGDAYQTEKIACGFGYECKFGECKELDCTQDIDQIDIKDSIYDIEDYSSETLRLYVGDIVELDDDLIMRLVSVSGTQATVRIFQDYEKFDDNDEECEEDLEEGINENDLCGENTGDVEVDAVNDADDYADIILDDFKVIEVYSAEGEELVWLGSSCPDDEVVYEEFDMYFHPYLDTESSGLNLDGYSFFILGEYADLIDIDLGDGEIRFELDNDDYRLEDGDKFEYNGQDYEVDLYFHDGGLYRMLIQLD